jgi:hypothetical protein
MNAVLIIPLKIKKGVVMARKCRVREFEECIDDGTGKCTNCGTFMKGNVHGTNSKRRDAVKVAIKDAVTPAEARELLNRLMNSKNENVSLKALHMYLDRILGKAITPIITDKEKDGTDIVSESFKNRLADLLDSEDG